MSSRDPALLRGDQRGQDGFAHINTFLKQLHSYPLYQRNTLSTRLTKVYLQTLVVFLTRLLLLCLFLSGRLTSFRRSDSGRPDSFRTSVIPIREHLAYFSSVFRMSRSSGLRMSGQLPDVRKIHQRALCLFCTYFPDASVVRSLVVRS